MNTTIREKDPFAMTPLRVSRELRLSPSQNALYSEMSYVENSKTNECWMPYDRFMRKTGYSKRTTYNAFLGLKKKKLIKFIGKIKHYNYNIYKMLQSAKLRTASNNQQNKKASKLTDNVKNKYTNIIKKCANPASHVTPFLQVQKSATSSSNKVRLITEYTNKKKTKQTRNKTKELKSKLKSKLPIVTQPTNPQQDKKPEIKPEVKSKLSDAEIDVAKKLHSFKIVKTYAVTLVKNYGVKH